MSELKGLCVITVTPFHEDGSLDEESLRKLTDFYIDCGVHGMTILGIMGEAHKLSEVERMQVIDIVLHQTKARVPVVVGCSAPGSNLAAEWALKAEHAGAAAVMIAPPVNLRNEDMLIRYFAMIADHISIPIVLQDEPVTTGVRLSPAFIARLVEKVPLIQYVKLEEAPTTIKISSILELTDLRIFGGLGGMYLYEELDRGAVGIMTGFAYPEILVKTYDLFTAGNQDEARAYFYRFLPLIRFEAQLGIGGVTIRKETFKLRHTIASSHVRFPGTPVDKRTMQELQDMIAFLGLS
ncbi:dihydrodipicolinate synthase family protein [Paenibacillus sp. WQ 127069]|uniref:Dihydrodipicolinate synthase family protein n=1 Tax=Paenibacillus baimaensis TaxID=2982185 RepID=A0ABT2UC35_9BACL|nr:dihydrodipicolinate synthase family protein [Paenibacillus sp. WQ 127069]MCU6792195.1 dihydrodipicolinate synthase family protein [Paenibacillus sp. WQ 127069]